MARLPQFSPLYSGYTLHTGCTVLPDSFPWVPDNKPDAVSSGASSCIGRFCYPQKEDGKGKGRERKGTPTLPWEGLYHRFRAEPMANHFGSLGWLAQKVEAAQRVEAAQCFVTSKGKADLGRPQESLSFFRWILVPGWHCGGQAGNGQLTHTSARPGFLSSVLVSWGSMLSASSACVPTPGVGL